MGDLQQTPLPILGGNDSHAYSWPTAGDRTVLSKVRKLLPSAQLYPKLHALPRTAHESMRSVKATLQRRRELLSRRRELARRQRSTPDGTFEAAWLRHNKPSRWQILVAAE